MPQNKEVFNIIATQNRDSETQELLLDPREVSFSLLQELVKNKVRSIEETTIYMDFGNVYVYVDPARLHKINHLPQQKRARVIKQTTINIAHSDRALICSEIAKDDI